jgi:hypothetical protein
MADLKEIPCFMFRFKMGKYVTEFFEMLKIVFGKETSARTQVIYRVKGRARTRLRAHIHTHIHTHAHSTHYVLSIARILGMSNQLQAPYSRRLTVFS